MAKEDTVDETEFTQRTGYVTQATHVLLQNLLAAALILFSAISARAEEPEAVARAMFAAVGERGMNAIPEFVHPDELQRFKDSTFAFLRFIGGTSEQMRHEAFGSDTKLEEIRTMPPLVYMQRFMKVLSSRLDGVGYKNEGSDILGKVQEGEVVHLVIRSRASGGTIKTGQVKTNQVEVLTLRPFGDTWKGVLPAQVDVIAEQLRIAAEVRR
jgi:hypothetical protein